MANLLHIKGSRNKILSTLPSNSMGADGDIILSSIKGKGIYLCSKVNGKWHVSNKMEELRKIEKTSIKDLRLDRIKIGNTTITKSGAIIGGDVDGTDRTITFGHSTLKTIMGIDDSADAFVINTDAAFDGTLANNSLSIDASHNVIIAGTVTAGGFTTTGTWTFDEYTSGTVGITTVQDSGTTFNDNDTSLMTAAAIADKIEAYGYSTTTGDITGVTLTGDSGGALADTAGSADFTIAGGTNCTSAGSGSTITVNVDDAFITNDANDTMAGTLTIDKNLTNTTTATEKGLYIDCDHVGEISSGQTLTAIAFDLDMNCNLGDANHPLSALHQTGIDIDMVATNDGNQSNTGIDINVSGGDNNYGIIVTSSDYQLKLVASADSDDYATFTVADTGDLTIATVGDGSLDSDITLDADGDIELNADGGQVYIKDNTSSIASFGVGDCRFNYDASNSLRLQVSSAGVCTLSTSGGTATAADFIVDAGGDIVLDSGTGRFIAKNAGTEFSIANSAYAGMILGYTDIGLNEADASYNLTTSYVVPTDEFGVTFTAPPSGNVEIFIQIQFDCGSNGAGDLHAGLSTANATSGYSALASYHEVEIIDQSGRFALEVAHHVWTITGLTAGTSYTYYAGFKSTSTTGTPHIQWGGNAANEIPDFIMKATALPATIST